MNTKPEIGKFEWVGKIAWFSAGATALALLLSVFDARAADPSDGFQKGKPFPNPFAGSNDEDFTSDDEEDYTDDEDFSPPPQFGQSRPITPPSGETAPRQRAASPTTGISVGGKPNDETPEPKFTRDGVSIGGGGSGMISHNRVAPIRINTETGKGSGEIVTDFNFPNVDILDLAKTMGKLTGKNFIVDKEVKGPVTIISNSPITVGDAWKAFLTALDMNGFALIPSGGYIRIARQRDARDKQLRTYVGEASPDSDALITRVFALKYISSEEVARTFRSFMPANSRIIPYEQTNTVIVTDTGSNIAKLAKMLEFLDVEGYDAGIEVVPVKFASASELAKLIDTLLPGTTTRGAPGSPPRPFGAPGFGSFSSRRTKEGGIINTIIADERTNNLIVHANTRGADQVRELVAKLDKKMPSVVGGGKVHVIYLQFADSEGISATMNNLTSGGGSSAASLPRPGIQGLGMNPNEKQLFEGNIKVSPDKATNSLVVTASPADFSTIQRVINKLDIPRDQVYVEIVIMEMSLSRGFSYSSSVASPTNGVSLAPNGDLLGFLASPFASTGALLGFKAGKESEFDVGGKKVKVSSVVGLVKALQTNSNANVLATPQILTLDNTEATFESAEKIPVEKSSVNQGVITSGIEKESIALSITIKPQINKLSNFVKLDINSKLADITNRNVPSSLEGKSFATIERNAKTSVVIADADTVALGGLVRDKRSETVNKIPILGDIPLLGWLFRSKESGTEKTNLFLFITPKIIRQYENIRALLDKKLKQRDDFLEKNAGGEDAFRDTRDDMIRSLPDMKSITNYKPDNTATIGFDPESMSDDGAINTPSLRTPPVDSGAVSPQPVLEPSPIGSPAP